MRALTVSRTFQGCAAGGMIPMVMITISDLFSVRFVPHFCFVVFALLFSPF